MIQIMNPRFKWCFKMAEEKLLTVRTGCFGVFLQKRA